MRLIDADLLEKEFIKDTPQGYGTVGIKYIDDLIKKQPTVEVPQWIPVEERLPSSDGMFLVTVKSRSGKRIDLCHFNKNAKLDSNKWGGQYYNRNVIAWQPLQQPYTENRKES